METPLEAAETNKRREQLADIPLSVIGKLLQESLGDHRLSTLSARLDHMQAAIVRLIDGQVK